MILNIREWFSRSEKELILGAILFIATSLSFGVGYLADHEHAHTPIIIEECGKH